MKMIRAIIRPEKVDGISEKLMEAGYPAMTRMDVYGRGKQKGVQVGTVFYDELPKQMIMMVVKEEEVDKIVEIISTNARTSEDGNFGDGRIFVFDVVKAYTISTKSYGL